MIRRTLAAIAIAAALGLAVAQAASAKSEAIELDCGDDGSMTVLVNGNGRWAPGRIVGGGVIHPVAFANQHGVFTDNEGHTETFNDPDISKAAPKNVELLDCSFEVTFTDENGTGTFGGDVTAWISGR